MFDEYIKKITKTIEYRKNQASIREQEILKIICKQIKAYNDEIEHCQNNKRCVDTISRDNQSFIEKSINILYKSNAMTDVIHLLLII